MASLCQLINVIIVTIIIVVIIIIIVLSLPAGKHSLSLWDAQIAAHCLVVKAAVCALNAVK
jgi:hypothetical protein